jgi:hypothetical protein
MSLKDKINVRRDTTANFTSANPVLSVGEISFDTTTKQFKVGDGSSTWTSLAYSNPSLSHTHGNITNAGAIGSTANLPLITTTSGVITVGSFGTTSNTFCQGNDSRLSDAREPTDHSADKITSGSLAKARQNAQTAYKDEANTFSEVNNFDAGFLALNASRVRDGIRLGGTEDNNWFLRRDIGTGDLLIQTYGATVITVAPTGLATFTGPVLIPTGGVSRFVDGVRLGNTGDNNWYFRRNAADGHLLISTFGSDLFEINTTGVFVTSLRTSSTSKVGDYTVATLPSAATNAGHEANVTDSSVTTFGSTVAGSGSNRVKVYSNGTNWTVQAT